MSQRSPSLALVLFHHNMELDVCAFGLRHIHGAVRRAGFPVHSLYVGFDPESDSGLEDFRGRILPELVQTLLGLNAQVVGFSVFSCYVPIIRRAIRAIREALPGTIIIAGGPDATLSPERMLNDVDYLFRGESEEAVPLFLTKLGAGEPLDQCPNIWFTRSARTGDGILPVISDSTVRNPMLPLVQNMDTLAWPDYANDGGHIYLNSQHQQTMGSMKWYSMMTSRGCPYKCEFCVNPVQRQAFEGLGNFLRRRSVASVMDELERVIQSNPSIEKLYFYDEVFTTDYRWVLEFSEAYRKRVGLPFFCQTDPRIFNERALPPLAAAGLRWLSMGLQGSPRVAKEFYDRAYTAEEIVNVGRLGKKHGFENIFDLIIDEPFSEENDRREVLEILLCIPRPYRLNTYSMLYFPGYLTTKRALKTGVIDEDRVEGTSSERFDWNRFLRTDKDSRVLFWECLYDLAANTAHPPDEIRRLADDAGLRDHPQPLTDPYLERRRTIRGTRDRTAAMVEHGNTL